MTVAQAIQIAQEHVVAKRNGAAETLARQVLAIEPGNVPAMCVLAVLAAAEARHQQAVDLLEEAMALGPSHTSDQYYVLGESYRQLMRLADARRALERAIELDPQNADARLSLSMCLMIQGDYGRGLAEFQWRWKSSKLKTQGIKFGRPEWDGSDPAGRTILLWAEQGLGDVVQAARYAPLLAARGAKVILGIQPPLVRLLRTVKNVAAVTSEFDQTPPFDLQLPIFSLPHHFGTTLETIPVNVPYVFADESLVSKWKTRLAEDPAQRKIGLIWGGSLTNPTDAQRSIPVTLLEPLSKVKDASFYSLQTDERAREVASAPRSLRIQSVGPELTDFADTAALLKNLDLLVTVDTAAAHVAGALGTPVWNLLAYFCDWRWMLDRADTPWYPTMRLFRQTIAGDWNQVIRDVVAELTR